MAHLTFSTKIRCGLTGPERNVDLDYRGVNERIETFLREVDRPGRAQSSIIVTGDFIESVYDEWCDWRFRQLLVEHGCLLNARWCLYEDEILTSGERWYEVDISQADLLPLRLRVLRA